MSLEVEFTNYPKFETLTSTNGANLQRLPSYPLHGRGIAAPKMCEERRHDCLC